MKRASGFWGSAVGAGIVFALLVPVLFPFRALGMSPADHDRVWLLTVFCAGMMALTFGASGMVGGRFLGFRDVYFAGSARQALKTYEQAGRALKARGWMNAGTWTVAFGGSLIAIYFLLSVALS
ncbi:MAG TPA: hypothetical protein VFJ16_19450 [Longimicrobium sp.]|nr:hypothetical protein [Longimicrobium sp.]